MKKISNAFLVSALLMIAAAGCKKSQDATPQTGDALTQTGTEQIISSENGVVTASRTVSGDNVTLILRPAKVNGSDAMILRYDPDPNYANLNKGQEVDIPALTWTAGGIPTYRRSLICFNQLSLIPSGATIVSAKLELYGLPSGGSPNCPQGNSYYTGGYSINPFWLQTCTSSWNEGSVTWNTQPTTNTLTQVSVQPPMGQFNVNCAGLTGINIKPFVQSWVATPPSNYGMMMVLQNELPYTSVTFGSSENTVNYRPKLTVVFHL